MGVIHLVSNSAVIGHGELGAVNLDSAYVDRDLEIDQSFLDNKCGRLSADRLEVNATLTSQGSPQPAVGGTEQSAYWMHNSPANFGGSSDLSMG